VAAIVAAKVMFGSGSGSSHHAAGASAAGAGSPAAAAIPIQGVSVFHLERNADNSPTVGNTHDGNPATVWMTDHYYGPNFGRLRHGLGLAITLDSKQRVHRLVVTSPTRGWSAEVYLASAVPGEVSLAPWGQPVSTKNGIDGSVTFDLGNHQAGAILLWITDLGPANQAAIAELAVN
jgi:hypothetical protein